MIAFYDAYLKNLAPIAEFLQKNNIEVSFLISNFISDRVIEQVGVSCPYQKISANNLRQGNYEQNADAIFVGAGGNAKIVERVLTRLLKTVPASNLRTSSIVVKVKVNENHVDIFYEDKEQKLRQIQKFILRQKKI